MFNDKNTTHTEKRLLMRVGIAVAFILAIFIAVQSVNAIKQFQYIGSDTAETATIDVSGDGDVFGVPDTARFRATVTESAKTVQEAQQAATERMNRAIEQIKRFDVDEKDIRTVDYSVNPRYEYRESACERGQPCPPEGKRQLVGYEVRQSVEVKVEKRETAGQIVSALGDLGVQEIGDVRMTIDDPEKLRSEARKKAIQDAKEKARQLAADLGVRLERIISFNESGDHPRPFAYERASVEGRGGAADASAPAPLPAGQEKITSNVTITYEIK